MAGPIVNIKILADASQATKTLENSSGRMKSYGNAMRSAIPTAVIGAGLLAAGNAASDLAETQSKVTQIFGASGKAVEEYAATAAGSLGQSQQSALDAAATFATFGKSAGLSGTKLVGFSTELTGLASDMASFSNTSPEEAIQAIGSALRGEAEPMRKYGVLLDDASLRAQALALGIVKTTKTALTPQQKVLAAQAAILKQTSAAQGDFARTSTGLANKQRILSAQMENTKTTLGQAILPLMLKVTTALSGVATWIGKNTALVTPLVVVLGSLAVVIWAVNFAMAANPFTLVAIAIGAVIVAVVVAYKKFTTFRNIVQGAFKVIGTAVSWYWNNVLKPVFGFIVAYVKLMWTTYQKAAVIIWAALQKIGGVARWLWQSVLRPVIAAIVGYVKWWWQTAITAKDKIVGTFTTLWTKAGVVKDKLVSAFTTIGEKLTNNVIVNAIQDIIGWLDKLFSKINNFSMPKWLTTLAGKVGNAIGLTSGPAYVAAPTVRGTGAAARTTASSPAAASSGAASTMSRLTGDGAQVIVQVSDRRMVDLVNVQLRDAATAAKRDLTRRQVVIV